MDRNMDLLPWILGGLSMATIAVAIAVGSSNRTAPHFTQAASQVTAPALPEAVAMDMPAQSTPILAAMPTVPATPPTPAPDVVTTQAEPAQGQPNTPSMASNDQIWECTTNGQRTFSSKPCGDKSFIREVSPINVMNPTPILPSARTGYESEARTAYEPESNYPAEYSYPAQESVDTSNRVLVGIPYIVRVRPDRNHHPFKHDRGPSTRKIY